MDDRKTFACPEIVTYRSDELVASVAFTLVASERD